MSEIYFEGEVFKDMDYTLKPFDKGEYENCQFIGCNFHKADVSGVEFIECSFTNCDLSMVKMGKTFLKDIQFIGCKMMGVVLSDCDDFLFKVNFESCIMDFMSFYNKSVKESMFKNSKMHEVDFTESLLNESVFDNCDLNRAIFDNSNLEKVDFISSFNYSIIPEKNRLKKTKFSKDGLAGLLTNYDLIIE